MTPCTSVIIGNMLEEIIENEILSCIEKAENKENLFDFCSYLKNLDCLEVEQKAKFNNKTFREWDVYFSEMTIEPVECFEKPVFRKCSRYYCASTAAFSPTRKRGTRIVFLKDLKNGGITEFKEKVRHYTNNTIPMFTCEKEMNNFIELFQWGDCKVYKASDLKIKTSRVSNTKKVDQVEIMDKKNWSGNICRRVLNNFDLSSVKKDILVVPLYKNGWLHEGEVSTNFEIFKKCIEKGLVKHIFFIRCATLRKFEKGTKKYNPHLKLWDTKNVLGGLTKRDVSVYLTVKAKSLIGGNDFTRQLLCDKGLVEGRDARLLKLATKPTTEEEEDMLRFKVSYIKGVSETLTPMYNSLGVFKTDRTKAVKKLRDRYPFLGSFTSTYYGEISLPLGTEKYYFHLINEVDNGRI